MMFSARRDGQKAHARASLLAGIFLLTNLISPREDKEADTLLAFASMGGSLDGNGKIDVGRLTKVC